MVKKCSICVSMVVLLAAVCSVQAVPMKYDFEAPGTTPTAGYTHVDHTTVYNAGQGYGFEDVDETAQYGQDYIGHFEGETYGVSNNTLTRDGVWWNFPWGMAWFIVDLPNGEYQITLGTGGVTYNRNHKLVVEGVTYELVGGDLSSAGAPLFTLNVFQDNWIKSSTLKAGTYGNILTYGHNQSVGDAEILLLENETVTVTDGQLHIGGLSSSDYNSLTFLEIVPEPATIALLGLNGLLLRRRR